VEVQVPWLIQALLVQIPPQSVTPQEEMPLEFHLAVVQVMQQQLEHKLLLLAIVDLSAVAAVPQEHQEQAQVVLVVLAIYLLAVLVRQEQEHLLVAVVAGLVTQALAQTLLLTMAVMVAQVAAVAVRLPR